MGKSKTATFRLKCHDVDRLIISGRSVSAISPWGNQRSRVVSVGIIHGARLTGAYAYVHSITVGGHEVREHDENVVRP